jgi:sugar/nucleoside kinase (ribokinase family)
MASWPLALCRADHYGAAKYHQKAPSMTAVQYAVLAIGNAIVDVIADAEDAFIETQALTKGGMTLIDAERAEALYAAMGPGREISGGSAANSLAGLAGLGHKTAFVGQVADDQLGDVFAHDVRATGIDFAVPPMSGDTPTARCLILVTPDGQRTMNTFLGAAQYLPESAIDKAKIEASEWLYLEGYLWNAPESRAAMIGAIKVAKAAERKVALTLSDAFVVHGHRDEFFDLIDKGLIDLLFANDTEVRAMEQNDDTDAAVKALAARIPMLVCTHGAAGAEAHRGTEHARVAAEPVDRVVDTTGAGDLFAAGVFAGLAEGRSLADCLTMGAVCAAEVISHYGARPEKDLAELVKVRLG